jgi:hypothetical protein
MGWFFVYRRIRWPRAFALGDGGRVDRMVGGGEGRLAGWIQAGDLEAQIAEVTDFP